MRITTILQLYDLLPESERMIVDVLRQLIIETLPGECKEKISYNVPFFYRTRGLCIVWPAAIPRGGIKEGVLLGFWYGNQLNDADNYLTRGSNKQIFFKIFKSVDNINPEPIIRLLHEAVRVDKLPSPVSFAKRKLF